MKSYQDLLRHIMAHGEDRTDRTGVGTRAVFGYQWRHDLADGFPLLTTKKVHLKSVLVELLWFLNGRTDVKWLNDRGCTIWDEWVQPDGTLGPIYGHQWREWNKGTAANEQSVDQIMWLMDQLKSSPDSRRMVVTAWNPSEMPRMSMPACHTLWQCQVSNQRRLNLHLYARSIDSFLGLPFNIASYAALLHILAYCAGLGYGELVVSFGDLHIYRNHFSQVKEQLSREPRPLPQFSFTFSDARPANPMPWDFDLGDFVLTGYDPHPAIKAEVAV